MRIYYFPFKVFHHRYILTYIYWSRNSYTLCQVSSYVVFSGFLHSLLVYFFHPSLFATTLLASTGSNPFLFIISLVLVSHVGRPLLLLFGLGSHAPLSPQSFFYEVVDRFYFEVSSFIYVFISDAWSFLLCLNSMFHIRISVLVYTLFCIWSIFFI